VTGAAASSPPIQEVILEFDVLQCPCCGGRMKIIAAIESPEVAYRILYSLGSFKKFEFASNAHHGL
jgi:hypothetical protein